MTERVIQLGQRLARSRMLAYSLRLKWDFILLLVVCILR